MRYQEDEYPEYEYPEYEYDEDAYDQELDLPYEEEYEEERPSHGGLRVAAGVFDFLGVVLNAILILLLLVIMTTLFTWLRQDLSDTFASIGENINDAVLIDGGEAQEAESFQPAGDAQPQQGGGGLLQETPAPQVIDLQPVPQG